MTKSAKPMQTQDKFVVRLPDGMRDQIAAAAEASGRSMNAEIVQRLADSLEPANTTQRVVELIRRANSMAMSAGMLSGRIKGAAAVLELQADLPKGAFSSGLQEDTEEFVARLQAFEEAVKSMWSQTGFSETLGTEKPVRRKR